MGKASQSKKIEAKIIALMPTRGLIVTETEMALDRELAMNQQMPVIIRTHDLPLPVSRNFLVDCALAQDWWTHALLLDDDVILPEGALKEMLKLKANIAVMNYPIHIKLDGKPVGTIVHDHDNSIAYAGLGAVLVEREVFEKMPSPWFALTQYRVRRGNKGEIGFYAGQQDDGQQLSAGEDTHFYLQARKHNFSVKETKKTAEHARIDQLVTNTHTIRYGRQHRITKSSKIERELL